MMLIALSDVTGLELIIILFSSYLITYNHTKTRQKDRTSGMLNLLLVTRVVHE